MEINIEQLREHIRLLRGSDKAPVHWQFYYDPKNEEEKPELAYHFYGTLDDNLELIKEAQSKYCGVYIVVNHTNGVGRRAHDIVKIDFVFADFDGIAEPQWPITPHFIARRSPTNGHAYFKLKGDVTVEQYRNLQKKISLAMNTDGQVTDPSRVLRACGTNHYKVKTDPQQYSIGSDYTKLVGSDHGYTIEELERAFVLNAQDDAHLQAWIASRAGLQEGSGYTDEKKYIDKVTNWLTTLAPICIDGSGEAQNNLIRVALYGHDHGISHDKMNELMWQHFNPRCVPPWGDHERYHFDRVVKNAYRYNTSAAGCKTAVGSFKSAPKVPEPIGGWEANSKIHAPKQITAVEAVESLREDHRLSEEEATNLFTSMNEKSPHYDCARAFDGMVFNGQELIRHKKDFFAYNGKAWELMDDDVVRNKIQRMFAKYKPSDTFTNGVFKCLSDLVNVAALRDGMKLSDPYEDCTNLVPFRNAIVNIETGQMMEHNCDFFTFAELDYDYDPAKTNAELFNKTLLEIFSGCEETATAMKEYIGYCMTTETKYQKFAIFAGLSRAGKGVLAHIITKLIGKKSISSPQLANLIQDSVLDDICQKKVAFIPEAHNVPVQRRDGVVSILKAITGGDSITFHKIYKGARTVFPTTRFILSTNNVPEFIDASGALANRMMVFPFRNSFAGREDFDLTKKLNLEAEAIAQDCLKAYEKVKERGHFTESTMMAYEREEIKEDMNPLSTFFARFCEFSNDFQATTKELHDYYMICARAAHERQPFSETKFSRHLKASGQGLVSIRIADEMGFQSRGWRGIRVNPEVKNNLTSGQVYNFPKRA